MKNPCDVEKLIDERRIIFDKFLLSYLEKLKWKNGAQSMIGSAIEYSLRNGGKRMRPILILLTFESTGGEDIRIPLPIGLAIEFIHTYSLIHDDLPAMDNDDFRRGKPSLHRRFGEGVAILAGDGLLGEAFRVASNLSLFPEGMNTDRLLRIIYEMGEIVGVSGMIKGQSLDTGFEGERIDLQAIERMHFLKCAIMIRLCFRCGVILAGGGEAMIEHMGRAGESYGMAFQTADDMKDFRNKSERSNILNFIDERQAIERVSLLIREAERSIEKAGLDPAYFSQIMGYFLERV